MSLYIDEGVRPTFGGHEKFVFRHGWLKKGVDAAAEDPLIFTHDDALVVLGVGKNMVRSIRHWCLAMELLEAGKAGLTRPLHPTPIARSLLFEGGWDPYLEDMGTLWLLHWQVISNQVRALVWYLAFTAYLESEFNKKRLAAYIARQFSHLGVRTTPNSIDREVDCFLRTYNPATRSIQGVITEDSLDCPLAELDLMRYFPDDGSYHFNVGPKISLPSAIFGYALLNYLPRLARTRRTVAVEECIYQPGSPGQAFKLDENSVMEHLEWLEQATKGDLRLQETAGLRQIYLDDTLSNNWEAQSIKLLDKYYARS